MGEKNRFSFFPPFPPFPSFHQRVKNRTPPKSVLENGRQSILNGQILISNTMLLENLSDPICLADSLSVSSRAKVLRHESRTSDNWSLLNIIQPISSHATAVPASRTVHCVQKLLRISKKDILCGALPKCLPAKSGLPRVHECNTSD